MQNLQINNLNFNYTDVNIFTNLNLNLKTSWTAIVGNNGCGKTTLLRLIAEELKPHNGVIFGNNLVYFCKQYIEDKPLGFDEFIYAYDSSSFMLKDLLQIQDEWFYSWEELSFGQKKRIQIAIALYQDVDVLLLDEPTNHLDIYSKKIVIEALKNYKGIGVLVSHDREVLDSLSKNTIIIKNNNIYEYNTNYSNAIKEFDNHMNFLKNENEKINTQLKKLKNSIKIQKEKVAISKNRLSKKSIDKSDKSTKEKINLAKLTGKDKNDSKLVSSFSKKYEDLSHKLKYVDKDYKKGIDINFYDTKKHKKSFFIKKAVLKLSENKSLYFSDFFINHDSKIGIIGANGVGKSSFVKYLLSKMKVENNCFYLPQEITKSEELKLYKEIDNLDEKQKGLLFTLVKRLSSKPKNILENKNLSSGELRKLFIAKAILENIDFIILDEPTNHMDIDSILALENALLEYKKALIIISHDKNFMENLNLDIYKIEEKQEGVFSLEKSCL